MRRRRIPIRARLTMWQVGVFACILAALAIVLVAYQRATLQTNAQESLELTARVVVDRLNEPSTSLEAILRQGTIPGELGTPEVIGQVLSPGGRVIDGYGTARATSAALVGTRVIEDARRDGHWHGRLHLPGRSTDDMVIAVALADGAHAGDVLVLADTLDPVDRGVAHIARLLLAVLPLALAAAVIAGWFVIRAALRPVDDLTRRAASVDAVGPLVPLPVPPGDDEISRLAVTLNGMLDRLHRALEAERRFSADASHELRTPIGIMEAELDVAMRSRTTPPDARAALASVREEASNLGRIVSNLLLLSRAEATGEVALDRRDEDLLDLALGVVRRFLPRAAEGGVTLSVEGDPSLVWADADLLRQALSNLIDNALHHTGPGGSVSVTVRDGATPTLSVADTGSGIPPDELEHIFDRFYRVDRARRRGGAGLGLEITRRIAEAHGGRIDVESRPGLGSTFAIVLPRTADDVATAAGSPGPAASGSVQRRAAT